MCNELSQLLRAHDEAQGKANLYADLTVFLKKYGERLHRQYNDSNKAYNRLKKSGKTDESMRALTSAVQLQYQELAQRDFLIEILQRQQDILQQTMSAKQALAAYFEKHGEEESPAST